VDAKDKSVKEKDIANDLQMFYFPIGGTDEYGIVTVTVTVPGSIRYISSGGEIEKATWLFSKDRILLLSSKKVADSRFG
jgi:hypothetical protein